MTATVWLAVLVAVLCLAGLYCSVYMSLKMRRAERGLLEEPSVVMSPRAKVGGVPNSLVGLVYYLAMFIAAPALGNPVVREAALIAAALASAFSLYLAYSLLFVTKRPCAMCWTGHVINWSLLVLLVVRTHLPR